LQDRRFARRDRSDLLGVVVPEAAVRNAVALRCDRRRRPIRVNTDPRDRSGYGAALYFGNDLYQKTGDGRC
jgi:hypothetical protein